MYRITIQNKQKTQIQKYDTVTTFKAEVKYTRNTLDCDQSNYSSRIFSPTYLLNSVKPELKSADLENPILEPNTV